MNDLNNKVAIVTGSSRGITVNIVSPCPTDTPLFRKDKTEEQIKHFGDMAALGRIAEVEDIADA